MIETTTPLISFIIPIYNTAETMLSECIESIVGMPLEASEYEIIVVDDGSSMDYTASKETYKNTTVWLRQDNMGVSAARNAGKKVARGEYIQFVDADDKLRRGAYSAVIEHLKSRKYDIISFIFTTDECKNDCRQTQEMSMTATELMANHNIYSSACCYLFKRKAIEQVFFDEQLSYSEDDDFVTRALVTANDLLKTDHICYYYRQHKGSAIKTKNKENVKLRLDNIKRVIDKIDHLYNQLTGKKKEALLRRRSQMIMNYIYIILRLHALKELPTRTNELRQRGLLPLPIKKYTTTYLLFAIISRYI